MGEFKGTALTTGAREPDASLVALLEADHNIRARGHVACVNRSNNCGVSFKTCPFLRKHHQFSPWFIEDLVSNNRSSIEIHAGAGARQ